MNTEEKITGEEEIVREEEAPIDLSALEGLSDLTDLRDLETLAQIAGIAEEPADGGLGRIDREEAAKIIEACLFAAGHALSMQRLGDLVGMTQKDLKELAQDMIGRYEDRGIQLLILENSLQLVTKEEYREYIRAALGIRRGGNLSRSSLETIAIIAYNQPVTRTYVDEVRGVDSSYAINSLLDKGLIEPKGRLDVPGRPILYGTTPEFLMVFGLSSLTELPSADLFLHDEPEQLTLPIEEDAEREQPEELFESDTVGETQK